MQFNNIDHIVTYIGIENKCIRLYAVYADFSSRYSRMKKLIKDDLYNFNTTILDIDLSYTKNVWSWSQNIYTTIHSFQVEPNGNIENLTDALDTTSLEVGETYKANYYSLYNLVLMKQLTFFTSLKEAKNFLKEKHKSLYDSYIKDLDIRLKKYKKRMYKKMDTPNFNQKEYNRVIKAAKKYKFKLSQYANS